METEERQRQHKGQCGEQRQKPGIDRARMAESDPPRQRRQRRAKTDHPLDLAPTTGDQPPAHMRLPCRTPVRLRKPHRLGRDVGLERGGTLRQFLDRTAISVACLEIHRGVVPVRRARKDRFDRARRFDETLPGNARDRGQGDDGARHHLAGIVGGGARSRHGGEGRVEIGQQARKRSDDGVEAVEPQHHGKRPKLGERQRTLRLVGRDEADRRAQRRLAVADVEIAARRHQHTRQSVVFGRGQPGQAGPERRRHVVLNLPDRTADLVLVVEKPFRRFGGFVGRVRAAAARKVQPGTDVARLQPDGGGPGTSALDGVVPPERHRRRLVGIGRYCRCECHARPGTALGLEGA